jgi:hypothetical protein
MWHVEGAILTDVAEQFVGFITVSSTGINVSENFRIYPLRFILNKSKFVHEIRPATHRQGFIILPQYSILRKQAASD